MPGQASPDPVPGPVLSLAPCPIEVRLRESIAARGMTLTELAQRTGVSVVNLSVLKNGHARAIRFSTLAKLCEALDCQPGDLLSWRGQSDE